MGSGATSGASRVSGVWVWVPELDFRPWGGGLIRRWGLGSGAGSLAGWCSWFFLGPFAHAMGASALVLGVG